MQKFLPFVFLFTMHFTVAHGNILRVGIDYTDIASAQTAAAPGDTLQIYGSQSGTITKRLVLMGFGYNLDVHLNLQSIGTESPSAANVTFQPGADSSIAEGLEISGYIACSKVIIRRCRGSINFYNYDRQISDIKIIGCIILGGGMQYSVYPCANIQVYNSLIENAFYLSRTAGGTGSSGAFINCVMGSPSILGNNEL